MGVSQWKNQGKKYGYWKYFLEGLRLKKKEDTTAKDLRAGSYRRGDDKFRQGYNQAKADLDKKIGELK